MKYFLKFTNKKGDEYTISSMEDYVETALDIKVFADVLSDVPVRKYITEDAMTRYGHATVESLAKDILTNSALRWKENAERRFLVRDSEERAVGMIGVTLENLEGGELWYYKTSSTPPFMQEALSATLNFLRKEGIKNLFATVDEENTHSRQILSKLGFQGLFAQGKMSMKI